MDIIDSVGVAGDKQKDGCILGRVSDIDININIKLENIDQGAVISIAWSCFDSIKKLKLSCQSIAIKLMMRILC